MNKIKKFHFGDPILRNIKIKWKKSIKKHQCNTKFNVNISVFDFNRALDKYPENRKKKWKYKKRKWWNGENAKIHEIYTTSNQQ